MQRFEKLGQHFYPHSASDDHGQDEGNARVFSAELFDQTRPLAGSAARRVVDDDRDSVAVEVLRVEQLLETLKRVGVRLDVA